MTLKLTEIGQDLVAAAASSGFSFLGVMRSAVLTAMQLRSDFPPRRTMVPSESQPRLHPRTDQQAPGKLF